MNEWAERELKTLQPAPGWHVDDPEMVERLETSLRHFGQLQPLICHGSLVVNGRGLLKAMLNLGWEKAMAVTVSGDYDPLTVSLATEIHFDVDYAKLSTVLKRIAGEPSTLARLSPYSEQRIKYFVALADFNWDDFKESDDQQSLWDEGDFVRPKGQAPSPKVKAGPQPKGARPSKVMTPSDRKMAPVPVPRPAPLVNQFRSIPATVAFSAPVSQQPIERMSLTPAVKEPEPEPVAVAVAAPIAVAAPQAPAPVAVAPTTVKPLSVFEQAGEGPGALVIAAPAPPKPTFSNLLDKPQKNMLESVMFSGHEEPLPDPNWRPAPLPTLPAGVPIDFDTETNGLRWFKGDRPIGIAVRLPDRSTHYVSWGHAGGNNCDEGTAKRWAQRELRNRHLTGANIKFDVHMMREWGVDLEEQSCGLSDVLHMAPLLDDTRRKWSLDVVSLEYLKELKSGTELDKSRMAEYHASLVAPYAMRDVELTGRCRDAMWPHLDAQDMHLVRLLEESIIYAVAEMERNAAPIDVELLHKWVHESEREVNAHLKDLVEGCGFMMDPEKNDHWTRLFEKIGQPITHFTETGAPSFADAVIRNIMHPLVQKARRVTKLKSIRSKFLLPYMEDVREYGLVRFNLHQLRGDKNGTVRGRFSASDQNIQQVFNAENQRKAFGIAEDDDSHDDQIYLIRKLFKAGSDAYDFLSSDAMQIEYRIMAHLAEDPRMLEAYAKDPLISYHNLVWDMVRPFKADLIYGKVKILNFMLMYGGGKDTTAETLEMPRSESDAFVALYKETFPYTDQLFKRIKSEAETEGFVSTLLGRRARFPSGKFSHAALNAVIQGTAADIMKMKIAELHAARKKTGLIMRMTVHDEVCGDAPKDSDCKDEVSKVLNEQSMSLKVPILWKTSLASNWADC